MMNKKSVFLVFLVLLLFPTQSHADIQEFSLISDFPDVIIGGNTITALYQLTTDSFTQTDLAFYLDSTGGLTQDLEEFPYRSISINDNIIPNCIETSDSSSFLIFCSQNLTAGIYNVSIQLTTAIHIEPTTFDYALALAPMAELPEPIPPEFSTGGSYTPPVVLQKTVYLSHLENTSYEKYKYSPSEVNKTKNKTMPIEIVAAFTVPDQDTFLVRDDTPLGWFKVVILFVGMSSVILYLWLKRKSTRYQERNR